MLRTLAVLACGLAVTASAHAEPARIARGELRGGTAAGLVCFLPAAGKAGAVAVGAAHSFDRTQLAEVGEVAFRRPDAAAPVAVSHRYFASPGRAYHAPGATPRDDHVVFALDAAPQGVRLLAPAALPEVGARVEIIGFLGESEAALAGRVTKSAAGAIEVELEERADLRGWGGAPALLAGTDSVIGLLQAARPTSDRTHATIGPIAGATAAIDAPFEAGLGRLFATLAPPPSAANSATLRRRDAADTALAERPPEEIAMRVAEALRDAAPPARAAAPLVVTIESPEPETIFGDAAGAFLAGRAVAEGSGAGRTGASRYDVFLVIDTSESAGWPSGADVDGDGTTGVAVAAPIPGSSDPGDSILAAEVAAARTVIEGLDPKRTRTGVVTFAGDVYSVPSPRSRRFAIRRAAVVREPLTSDPRRLRAALDELVKTDPLGGTHMAAGIDLATLELVGISGAIGSADPDSTKIVLFFTDGDPTLPHPFRTLLNVREVLLAADRAHRAGVRIHSFAIGPEALERPFAAVEMAAITGGTFTPVPDPGRLSQFVEAMNLAEVAEVAVRNTTNGESAHEVRLHPDGSWEALVPLAVGKNRIEVRARAQSGEEATAGILVHYAPGTARGILPAELVDKYNRLLEGRLLTLTAEQRERTRKELVLEIERARAEALGRAEVTRKELELRAEPTAAP